MPTKFKKNKNKKKIIESKKERGYEQFYLCWTWNESQ